MPFTSDEYTATNATVDNYEVDRQLIRNDRLNYLGRNNAGNRIWEDDQGHQYNANDLALRDSEGRPVVGSADSGGANGGGQNGGSTYNNNYIANPSQVTQPPTPVIYFPTSNSSGSSSSPSSQNSSNYPKGHVLNTSDILGSKGQVTGSKTMVTDFGKQSGNRINSTQNEPMTVPDNTKGDAVEDKCKKSHLFLRAKDKDEVDDAVREFFGYMNDRSGGIFDLCKNGRVILLDGKSPKEVVPSQTVSQILAYTIESSINGGVGYNKAAIAHDVHLKIYVPESDDWNQKVYLDSFDLGYIDVLDYRNTLVERFHEPKSNSEEKLCNEIFQASSIGHVLMEYYSYLNFSENNKSLFTPFIGSDGRLTTEFAPYHGKGVTRECEIITEMALKKGTEGKVTERWAPKDKYVLLNREEKIDQSQLANVDHINIPFIYPIKKEDKEAIGTIIIRQFFSVKNGKIKGRILLSAEVIKDKNWFLNENSPLYEK